MSLLSSIVLRHLPHKKKTTPSGWISFNAPCCIFNGHSADTRGRGGLVINANEGLSYHCFNCGFKTGWNPGKPITIKMRKFLGWIGVPDAEINKAALQILKLNEGVAVVEKKIILPEFKTIKIPDHFTPIRTNSKILKYIEERNLYTTDIDFYTSDDLKWRNRLIIPFFHNNQLTGYTGRAINDKKPKYLTESQPGYIFNIDKQNEFRKFCIVCEGPIDALQIDAVSILGSEISDQQKLQIQSLERQIIVIADRDKSGKKLAEQAADLGWAVSFPRWETGINDISDAVAKYGRIVTLRTILDYTEFNNLKIKLGIKKWFNLKKF